jgi:adenosylcobinamide kinase / adenosylcobinamide-phosphate guanylyltransferase
MRVILVTGGARSGKSACAERAALALGGEAVTYVATAAAGDEEMAARIQRHRSQRPPGWETVEAEHGVADAIAAGRGVVLLDCLPLLASNLLLGLESAGEEDAIGAVLAGTDALLRAAAAREGTLIVVSNEVGMGLVPPYPLGRWFRDALGLANQRVAMAADTVVLSVAGIPLAIKGSL